MLAVLVTACFSGFSSRFTSVALADAESRGIRIRAQTRVADVGASADGDRLVLRGRLLDELDQPVPGAELLLSVGAPPTFPASACSGHPAPEAARDGHRVRTEADGTFCLRLPLEASGLTAKLTYAGDLYHDAVSVNAPLEPHRMRLRLVFDRPVVEVPLEKAMVEVGIAAHADGPSAAGNSLRIVVLHRPDGEETATELGTVEAIVGRRARFALPTNKLGPPGSGTLLARHGGSIATEPVETTAIVRRTARVVLSVAGALEPVPVGDDIDLVLGATSSAGAVPNGWLEATIDGNPIGTGEVHRGAARLRARFEAMRPGKVDVLVRYIGADPWWVPGEPLVVAVPVAPASAWSRLPWLLAVSAIAYFIMRAWRRPGRTEKARAEGRSPAGRAEVSLVEKGTPDSGWTGRVLDAHDGMPIREARVQILLPAFHGEGIHASAVTNDQGAFELPALRVERPEGARLEVTALHHSRLSRPLPPAGKVVVSMVSRRRAVLDYLVAWARSRGRPWAASSDPTPAHVVATAEAQREPETITWARAVEEAAYGPHPPDERREEELKRREPAAPPDPSRRREV